MNPFCSYLIKTAAVTVYTPLRQTNRQNITDVWALFKIVWAVENSAPAISIIRP